MMSLIFQYLWALDTSVLQTRPRLQFTHSTLALDNHELQLIELAFRLGACLGGFGFKGGPY